MSRFNTYTEAARLTGLASDSLYTFAPGARQIPITEDLTATAHFTEHSWGIAARLIWLDDQHHTLAAAEASVRGGRNPSGSITARIRQFRAGGMLWTHTAKPVTTEPVSAAPGKHFLASDGNSAFHLWAEPDLDTPTVATIRWNWVLADATCSQRFPSIDDALTYIDRTLCPAIR
ncbi:hypothetical protein JNN96_37600 [Mycobacterium sp. DSM 3803]|nr:hypothetical protein [Mycobacterium sp. DSM 3803]